MRIASTLSAVDLAAQEGLLRALTLLDETGVRLAAAFRINRGADDPAGLIAVGQLQAELAELEALDRTAGRMAGAIHVADSAMAHVGELLGAVRGHLIEAAGGGSSDAEIAARQQEIDAALEAINRIGGSTTFGGRLLLDGSYTLSFSAGGSASSLTLPKIAASALGGPAGQLADLATGGPASLASGDPAKAVEILDAAQDQVLQARAQAGAFEKFTLESTQRVLQSAQIAQAAAVGQIRDADMAAELSGRIRSELLVQAAISSILHLGRARQAAVGLLRG
ncbi:MAG: flagellin [Thermoguttaceae bacterium]